jgi:hypothetical protein
MIVVTSVVCAERSEFIAFNRIDIGATRSKETQEPRHVRQIASLPGIIDAQYRLIRRLWSAINERR